VRVDLYNYDGKIIAGELTFGPGAGKEKIKGKGCDKKCFLNLGNIQNTDNVRL